MDPSALRCIVCPKVPHFSDLSHLLTHVSSKAHLSHYFNCKLRSLKDSGALRLLAEYDIWYDQNHLAKALSDRLASKQSRKGRPSDRNGSCSTATIYSMDMPPMIEPDPFTPNFLDPRLTHTFGGSGSVMVYPNPLAPARYFPAAETTTPVSDPQLSSFTGATSSQLIPLPRYPQAWKADGGPDCESSFQPSRQSRGLFQHPINGGVELVARFTPVSEAGLLTDNRNENIDTGVELELADKVDEIARLKGVYWPGMDVFDSATDEMRRQRNQKKDAKLLQVMERASEDITPTELVFSPSGTLRKCRVISGKVEEGSPLKGETPIPKRRAQRARRRPLADTDSNQPITPFKDRQASKRALMSTSPLADLPRRVLFRLDKPLCVQPAIALEADSVADDGDNYSCNLTRITEARYSKRSRPSTSVLQQRNRKMSGPLAKGRKPKKMMPIDFTSDDKENVEPEFLAHGCDGRGEAHEAYWDEMVRSDQKIRSSFPAFGNPYYAAEISSFSEPEIFGQAKNPLWPSRYFGHAFDQELFVNHDNNDFHFRNAASPNATITDIENDVFRHLCADSLLVEKKEAQ